MRILVIGAHPADAVDLAGGTIAQHSNAGDEVGVLTITDGIYSHTSYSDIIVEDKRKEVQDALRVLGIDADNIWFQGCRDEPLIIGLNLIENIMQKIRWFKPDILITHHPNEYAHWDHAATGEAICRALKGAIKTPGFRWVVNNVYFFATQFRPETARLGYVPVAPDVLIDISDVVDRKVQAMCCFKSQGHNDSVLMWQRMNSMEREMGRADGLDYSEGFISYHPLKEKLLPVSSIDKSFYIKEKGDEKSLKGERK